MPPKKIRCFQNDIYIVMSIMAAPVVVSRSRMTKQINREITEGWRKRCIFCKLYVGT